MLGSPVISAREGGAADIVCESREEIQTCQLRSPSGGNILLEGGGGQLGTRISILETNSSFHCGARIDPVQVDNT